MMGKARWYHAVRGLLAAVVAAVLGWGSYEAYGTLKAHALRDRLLDANTADVPTIVKAMNSYRRWLDPLLRDAAVEAEANNEPRKHLRVSLALLPVDAGQIDYLYPRLLDAEPHEAPVIWDALAPHKQALVDKLWVVVEGPVKGKEAHRLRAASALASYDPDNPWWDQSSCKVVEDLVSVNPFDLRLWSEVLRPVKAMLLGPLSVIFRDRKTERTAERTLATNLLTDYAADQPQVLADLLMDADEKQFTLWYAKLKELAERGMPVLADEVDRRLPLEATEADKERLAKRQANAAVALLKVNQPAKVWPLLKHSPDPRVRSYLIHRFGPLGIEAEVIVKQLVEQLDVTIQRALILSLGSEEFGEKAWTPEDKKLLLQRLRETYRTAEDPGLHAAAEWL